MKVIVTGGSGFIGRNLTSALLEKNHQVSILDHRPPRQEIEYSEVDLAGQELDAEILQDADAIIHLTGKNIFSRWNRRVKRTIYESRILGDRNLVRSITKLNQKPKVLISASAVGYYGDRGEEDLCESSSPGSDFLARVCVDWEKESRQAEAIGLRTVQVRTAPVMGHGGMLMKMLPIYKWGLGGSLASGRQWFPWIHIKDVVNVYVFALENESITGPVNACSPCLIRNKEFSDTLAGVLKRPAPLRLPWWALRLGLNDLADAMLASQKIHPQKLAETGYVFSFPAIRETLEDILRNSPPNLEEK